MMTARWLPLRTLGNADGPRACTMCLVLPAGLRHTPSTLAGLFSIIHFPGCS